MGAAAQEGGGASMGQGLRQENSDNANPAPFQGTCMQRLETRKWQRAGICRLHAASPPPLVMSPLPFTCQVHPGLLY